MAHFAKLDNNNNVIDVHVVNNDVITIDGTESEQLGIDFLTSLYGHTKWKQTSYNKNFRGKYAGKGMIYDEVLDVFIFPKPNLTWILDTSDWKWKPPVEKPNDGKRYSWDESTQNWLEFNLPEPGISGKE